MSRPRGRAHVDRAVQPRLGSRSHGRLRRPPTGIMSRNDDADDLRTPLTSTSQFIEAGVYRTDHVSRRVLRMPTCCALDNDDDLDDEAIPGFTHPALTPDSAGKGKARDDSPPPGSALPRSPVSGNIGSSSNGSARPTRNTVGGVQVEMRYVAPS